MKKADPEHMTKNMSKASETTAAAMHSRPHRGERLRCDHCGMELQVNQECTCKEHPALVCCGEAMHSV